MCESTYPDLYVMTTLCRFVQCKFWRDFHDAIIQLVLQTQKGSYLTYIIKIFLFQILYPSTQKTFHTFSMGSIAVVCNLFNDCLLCCYPLWYDSDFLVLHKFWFNMILLFWQGKTATRKAIWSRIQIPRTAISISIHSISTCYIITFK